MSSVFLMSVVSLPSVFYWMLGIQLLCGAPNKRQSAKGQALRKLAYSSCARRLSEASSINIFFPFLHGMLWMEKIVTFVGWLSCRMVLILPNIYPYNCCFASFLRCMAHICSTMELICAHIIQLISHKSHTSLA